MKISTNDAAQANCANKFTYGGQLFEPLSHTTSDGVLIASRNVIPAGDNWFHIGVKRAVGESEFKYLSNDVVVPFDLPWFNDRTHSRFC